MPVIVDVCFKQGHNITSQIIGQIFEPVHKVLVNRYEYRCTQCGKTPAEIEKYKTPGRSGSRKRKSNEHSNHPAGNGTTETSETIPVAGAERDLPEPGMPEGSDPENS